MERGFWSPGNEFSPLAHMFSMPLASRVTKPAVTGFPVRCDYTKSFIMCHLSGHATVTPNGPKGHDDGQQTAVEGNGITLGVGKSRLAPSGIVS